MPKIVNFNNKQIIEPGAYSQIKSGETVPAVLGTYGNVMIIDTGVGAGYGWGSGINGELESGAKAIYSFTDGDDMKKAIKGGLVYDLMSYLWSPSKNSSGPKKVYYARAATTTPAKYSINFEGKTIKFSATSEGTVGNGAVNTINGVDVLTRGYGVKLSAGIIDSSKMILTFYEGKYRGADINGVDYSTAETELSNSVICKSKEFETTKELYNWMKNSYVFKTYFSIDETSSDAYTDDKMTDVNAVITTYSSIKLFQGGTCVYNPTDIDDVLESIEDLDNSLFLCLDSSAIEEHTDAEKLVGVNNGAVSTQNQKILSYCMNDSKFTDKILFIGGGDDEDEFIDVSVEAAKYYDSPYVAIVHSGVKVTDTTSSNSYKFLSSIYHAALVCGRTAGLEPQVPVTYKDLRILGLQHELKKSQRELALQYGVLHTIYQSQLGWIVNQGVNTLQNNDNLVDSDGKSPEIQIMRIIHQLNKELVINATSRFVGGNLMTSSAEEVKLFTEGYLTQRTATKFVDNLIIKFESVKVKLVDGDWNVTYCFVPNGPINRLFFTGFILDPNIEL